ncbi:MAG: efflux RND transporter periplasmic adaptor subunit [Gammaproteobacteria bacterium]|nr:efflux RND transporter periplasmic adaptor subunit [Gammaproteobacteria bacterium]MBQ0774653.1 efflux RND transporter periplasmic adaptor subunit [Gammaproteobacteria bacterium]
MAYVKALLAKAPRSWRVLVVIVVACIALVAFSQASSDAVDMVTVVARKGDVERTVAAQGRIQPRDYVDVGAQVSGQLKTLHVMLGDQVKKGDLLAEIDAAVQMARVDASAAQLEAQQAQLAQANAQLRLARLQFKRQTGLREVDATSEDEFQISEAGVASAEAQVMVLQAQIRQTDSGLTEDKATLSYTKIYSPMDGLVATLLARVGQTLNTNQSAPVLMRIADLSSVTVSAEVSEADISRLSVGMPVYFSPIGEPDKKWFSTLRQILPTPTVTNNVVLYTALFDVDNDDGRLMADMTAQVHFVEESAKDVTVVPVSALKKRQKDGFDVTVIRHGDPVVQRVEIGVSDRILVEIKSGIEAGDKVVLEGAKAPGAGASDKASGRRRGPGLF